MKGGGWGRIVNFGSGSVFQGTAGQSHYAAAKAGVLGRTRSLVWTGWRSVRTASCWPAPAATGMCGCGIQRSVSRSASQYQPTSLTGEGMHGVAFSPYGKLLGIAGSSLPPSCAVTLGRHGRAGRLRFSSPGRGRTSLPGASVPCPGVTLSDAGGQGERTRTRLIVPEGASGCAVAFVRSDGLAPDPPADCADIGPVWLYNEVPACRVLPWRGSKEVRVTADL
jgi:hypothetical protein